MGRPPRGGVRPGISSHPPLTTVGDEDGVPFKNGEQFYYYVAARDLLGRDGAISLPLLVTICDRVGSTAPKMPLVGNHHEYVNGAAKQRLQVTWPAKVSTAEVTITGYRVYRWNTPDEALKFGGDPAFNAISPLIPHVPGKTNYTYIDDANNPPTTFASNSACARQSTTWRLRPSKRRAHTSSSTAATSACSA